MASTGLCPCGGRVSACMTGHLASSSGDLCPALTWFLVATSTASGHHLLNVRESQDGLDRFQVDLGCHRKNRESHPLTGHLSPAWRSLTDHSSPISLAFFWSSRFISSRVGPPSRYSIWAHCWQSSQVCLLKPSALLCFNPARC